MEKRGLLIVSFGTSHRDALESCILPVEHRIAAEFPNHEVRRAFGSRIIVRILRERDQVHVDTIEEALEKMKSDGFTDLIVQPTYVITGKEYDLLKEN